MKKLKGSCQCNKVQFSVSSDQYYPYQLCYCSICRKTDGGGGFAINISASVSTMKIKGEKFIRIHHARMTAPGQRAHSSSAERHFCGECGTSLWLFDSNWPELIHPLASAIDTPLPKPPSKTHIMLAFKAPWVVPDVGAKDRTHRKYPKESIEDWHKRHGFI